MDIIIPRFVDVATDLPIRFGNSPFYFVATNLETHQGHGRNSLGAFWGCGFLASYIRMIINHDIRIPINQPGFPMESQGTPVFFCLVAGW